MYKNLSNFMMPLFENHEEKPKRFLESFIPADPKTGLLFIVLKSVFPKSSNWFLENRF